MKKKSDSKGLFEIVILVIFLFFASLDLNDLSSIKDPEIKTSELPAPSENIGNETAEPEKLK